MQQNKRTQLKVAMGAVTQNEISIIGAVYEHNKVSKLAEDADGLRSSQTPRYCVPVSPSIAVEALLLYL